MTLMDCLKNMAGKLMAARIHGTVESILFARANSIAAADPGARARLARSSSPEDVIGDKYGLEKERRYREMKKS